MAAQLDRRRDAAEARAHDHDPLARPAACPVPCRHGRDGNGSRVFLAGCQRGRGPHDAGGGHPDRVGTLILVLLAILLVLAILSAVLGVVERRRRRRDPSGGSGG
ncbi:hypothetical protein GCM10023200_41490 [Actinomycetospora chlora]|uniref:LPXTG cell wall anchor domain-containing protein n=1 Tax=Actinomycetospora chlora TaxID=663608 RepID=A0ABP9BTU9_9PSEU